MIPRVIHYCWFGKSEMPESAQKCIESWKKYCPDFEIREWNETNFDTTMCEYAKEAYDAKKWAFVSDYARFWILYHYGGVYFDTDVEVLKPIDDLLEKGSFMGEEDYDKVKNKKKLTVAPGLGMGSETGHPFFREALDYYEEHHFIKEDGECDLTTVVEITTALLLKHGFDPKSFDIQNVAGINIYPPVYFCPFNMYTGIISIDEKTYSIHHYMGSWATEYAIKMNKITWGLCRMFGAKIGTKLAAFAAKYYRIRQYGFWALAKRKLKRMMGRE